MAKTPEQTQKTWVGLVKKPTEIDPNNWRLSDDLNDLTRPSDDLIVFPPGTTDDDLFEAIESALLVRVPSSLPRKWTSMVNWACVRKDSGYLYSCLPRDLITSGHRQYGLNLSIYADRSLTNTGHEAPDAPRLIAAAVKNGEQLRGACDCARWLEAGIVLGTSGFLEFDEVEADRRLKEIERKERRSGKEMTRRAAANNAWGKAQNERWQLIAAVRNATCELRNHACAYLHKLSVDARRCIKDVQVAGHYDVPQYGRKVTDGPRDPLNALDVYRDWALTYNALLGVNAHRRLDGWDALRVAFHKLSDPVRNQPAWWCSNTETQLWWEAELKARRPRAKKPSPAPVSTQDTDTCDIGGD